MSILLNIKGELKTLSTPCIMGIINLTPDSFYEKSRINDEKSLLEAVEKMVEDGAQIIDLGAISTRPSAVIEDEQTERQRLIPNLKIIRKHFNHILISVDTFRANIAKEAFYEGADIINDISGGTFDPDMMKIVAEIKTPYIIMHLKGTPQTMHNKYYYDNLLQEINFFFSQQIQLATQNGITDIIIDPGFGFSKTIEHNFELLQKMELLKIHSKPILVGLSRKSMIYKTLQTTPSDNETLIGTTVLNTIALLKGASILRVHDVKEASIICKLMKQINE